MNAKLVIALLAPWITGVTLGSPAWLILLSGIAPWAVADWLARNTEFISIKQAFTGLLLIEALTCIAAGLWLAAHKGWKRFDQSRRTWLIAVLAPAALVGIGLAMRGTSVEFPSDSFHYYHFNFTQEQLASKVAPGLDYSSVHNWYYSTQYFLWNLQNNLSISTAGKIAGLNTFTAILAGTNLTWQLTKRWELAWLSCILFLVGLGHQSFSFIHQISLNGTLVGIALVLATTTPLLKSISVDNIDVKKLIGCTVVVLVTGSIAFKAHAATGYFTLNLAAATWIAASLAIKQSRIIRVITAALTTTGLAILNKKEFNPNLRLVYEYPEYMRIVHSISINGNTFYWFWPALPNSTLEITLIASTVLAIICLWIKAKGISTLANSTVALCSLPFIVFAEWLIPGINDLVFKLTSPEVAYRIAWTSLFWISIPVMTMEISNALSGRYHEINSWLKNGVLTMLALLAIPVHIGTESNIFNSKIPHLLSPLESTSVADGSSIEPIIKHLNSICILEKGLTQGYLLSDPFVGAVLSRANCGYPLAGLNYGRNSVESAEKGFYPDLSLAINNKQNLNKWLTEKQINMIVLKSSYPSYYSEIGMNSRHWQPDLVSGYKNLAVNQLNEALLKQVGFSKRLQGNNLLVFTRNS